MSGLPAQGTPWDARFASEDYLYGTAPNAFVAAEAARFAPASRVADLGAGEGRNAVFLAARGLRVTAVDTSAVGLSKARRLAAQRGVAIETALADVLTWTPEAPLDGAVMAFLHLPPQVRPAFWARVQTLVRPGGLVVGEWFRPEQRLEGYHSGGPPDPAWLVSEDELRSALDPAGVRLLARAEPVLSEGPGHRGPGAVVRLVWMRP
ncbi:MAG: SAM-dependent methyltransferase [Rubricoccaceae bacterium]